MAYDQKYDPHRRKGLMGRPDRVADTAVPLLVDRITTRFPDRVAASDETTALTYRGLTAAADRVARILIEHGVRPGDLVALALSRSVGYLVAMLGVLRAGAAYLPVDPDEPVARTRAALASVEARLLLTDGAAQFGLGLPQVFVAAIGHGDAPAEPVLTAAIGGDSPCYVMFTSGTTGRPKAVVAPHRAVTMLAWRPRFVSLAPGSVLLALAPLHFDAATFEIWGALCNGATVVMAPRPLLSAGDLRELIQRYRVNVLHLTAGLFRVLAEEEPDCFAGLDWLLTGGDVVSAGHVRDVARRFPRLRMVACYGPTEGTTFTSVAMLNMTGCAAGAVPLGEPLPGRRMEILDPRLCPVPTDAVGELYIGGVGLALGYLGRMAETAERFVPDPRPGRPGERLYRTGDLARCRADGTVEFLGRADDQVKIRGVRIEPAEVAAVLAGHPDVRDAVVVPRGPAGEAVLAAYVTAEPDRRPGDRALREFLGGRLPAAVIPSEFVTVDRFPVTAQGKVDRAALARARPARQTVVVGNPAVASMDELVLRTWRDCLEREIGPDDNIFELGGHSLMVLRVAARLERALGRRVPLRAIFKHPTAWGLGRWLAASSGEDLSFAGQPAPAAVPAATVSAGLAADLGAASSDEIATISRLLGLPGQEGYPE
jgi:amino acid adenylation domain-containing protein